MTNKKARYILEGNEKNISKIRDFIENLSECDDITLSSLDEPGKSTHMLSGSENDEWVFFHTLMDSIPDAIYFKDREHRFTRVNKYVHLHGLNSPDAAIGKTDFDFFTEEHARQAFEDEENIFKSGQPVINKVEKETFSSGEIAWVSSTKVPVYNAKGQITGLVGISRDITEFILKSQALVNSEERYRCLIEYSPDTITVIQNDKIIFINSAGIELLKASSVDDLINKDIDSIIHPQYLSLVKRFSSLIRKNEKPFNLKLIKIQNLQKEFLDAEITGIPTSFNNEPAVQLVIRDITDIKKQEKINQTTLRILQASNYSRNTNELFHYIHNAIGRLMPVKNFYIALYDEENQQIQFPYFVDETEDHADTIPIGKGLTEYILRTGKAQLIDEAADRELNEKGEIELVGVPSKIWLGVPLLIKDKTIGVMVVQDYEDENAYSKKDKDTLELISFSVSRAIERKRSEDEKQDYIEKLKESNIQKDRFFSFISHDLRGPFSSLLGFSELILEDYDTLSREETKRFMGIINTTARNLYHLLNNLLQYSRFQAGRVNFDPVKLNVRYVVSSSISLLKGNALKKEIQLIENSGEDDYVFADEEMLNSTIQNLLTNAIKFTPRGGNIKVSQGRIGSKFSEIRITDSGIGMSEEAIQNLFNIEKISSSAGTERESGSGLGLLLTKEFIEKNGGTIKVESHEGMGSTFSFTIPLIGQTAGDIKIKGSD